MTQQIFGIVMRMVKVASNRIVLVWCALHQLNLVVQVEYVKLYEDQFANILMGLISYLHW